MKNITSHTGTLSIVKREPSSLSGNPRFTCEVDGYRFKTTVDSMHGYAIQNYQDERVTVAIGTHYGQLSLHSIHQTT